MKPYISVVIPTFNEETRIINSLQKAIEYLKNNYTDYEIIVVDDGSTDNTIKVVRNFDNEVKIIALGKNLGKGAAVKKGMLEANGKYRIFTDADFSTPIHEIKKILHYLENNTDVCIGSRAIDRSLVKVHQPFYRESMGKVYNKFVQIFVFKGITDTQCGFKGFKDNAAIKLFSNAKIDGFSFDVEILYLAQKFNLSIEQTPVEWFNDKRSTVNPFKDSTQMFLELMKIKRLHKDLL